MFASGVISAYSASVPARIFVTVVVVHVVSFVMKPCIDVGFVHHRRLSFCTLDQSQGLALTVINVLDEYRFHGQYQLASTCVEDVVNVHVQAKPLLFHR